MTPLKRLGHFVMFALLCFAAVDTAWHGVRLNKWLVVGMFGSWALSNLMRAIAPEDEPA